MDSCKFTPFGLCVKTELLRRGQTQKWLANQIRASTGMYADDGYLYKILTGQRNAPKVVGAIREILNLPEQAGTENVLVRPETADRTRSFH